MTEIRIEGLRTRTLIFAACLALAFLGLVGRLAYLQVWKHDEYARLAENQHAKTVPLRPQRGPILDRAGQALAVSSRADTLYVTPVKVENAGRLAARLAPILGEPARDVARKLTVSRKFAPVRRRLTPDAARAVRELRDPSLTLVEDSLRLYPNRELAAQLIGFEGADGKGLAGMEQMWDGHLAGVEGRAVVERDALGREVTGAPIVLKPSVAGQGIMLTIDATIQYLAEKEVDAAWRRTRAKSAMAVVMDPRTGEILAMAIRPTYNPNAFSIATDDDRRARAVTDPFEPGSTFKVIMAASALEEGIVRPADRIFGENGAITIANSRIHDWKKYGWLTFTEVLQNSSNVGSIKVGLQLGRERYYKYMTAFGFGAPTSLGLPGESRGQLRPPAQWSGLSLATLSIGQEISVTGVQMVAAFSAVANGGRLMQPQIIRAVLDAQGRELRSFEPRTVRQVISPETSRTLTEMMVNVVANGTGRQAAIPGYDVAGKTGTAQKMDPATKRYSRAPGVLSFVGFVPADDPRLTMIVLLDEPKNEKWGSEAAAPMFAAIGREALRHLNVPPRDSSPVPIVRGEVVAAAPRAGAPAPPVGLTPEPPAAGDAQVVMPRLAGLSLRQAMEALAPFGVRLEITGRGVVTGQTPPPGAPLDEDAVCRLHLAPPAGRPQAALAASLLP
ncbi:MAG TPA: penicillin-binding transpeptidase domain-containing protein [Candidatus Limnocylindria bacterium]|nr:penicillin-binding transpeptidase domain-containing protein [Candidatus Limnocylindria bacterium]